MTEMIKEVLKNLISETLEALSVSNPKVFLEHPADIGHGDFSTNVALVFAKELGMKPRELAERIKERLNLSAAERLSLERVEIAGAGFINFYLSKNYFANEVSEIIKVGDGFGKNKKRAGQKVMVEFTDPNPFKEFHIGHLMSNTIGESLCRLIAFEGAEVKRATWQGDVGLHVAKAIWGALKNGEPKNPAKWGKAYATGSTAYEDDVLAKKEIEELNKKVYERSDEKINALYDSGRKISLEALEEIYKRLDTHFDYNFFESKEGRDGEAVILEFLKKAVFEESEGAIVFRGEKYGLHTRVFINSKGLPTYEAKELGLNRKKFEVEPDLSESIIITANEQSGYFSVLLKVLSLIYPAIGKKTKHLAHGLLKLPSGKMSSRKGDVITAESLINDIKKLVAEKIKDRGYDAALAEEIKEKVAIGAIKYSILRQAVGGDIIFDFEKSISFEGDSGPYLQYGLARAKSLLEKGKEAGIFGEGAEPKMPADWTTTPLEKLLTRFPEIVSRSAEEFSPHHLVTYLTELVATFNAFYAEGKIVDTANESASYKLTLVSAFAIVLKNGLALLGIPTPEKM